MNETITKKGIGTFFISQKFVDSGVLTKLVTRLSLCVLKIDRCRDLSVYRVIGYLPSFTKPADNATIPMYQIKLMYDEYQTFLGIRILSVD